MKYTVIRAHIGDRDYAVGDTREAEPRDVAHLVGKCLIDAVETPAPIDTSLLDAGAPSEPAPEVDGPAPSVDADAPAEPVAEPAAKVSKK